MTALTRFQSKNDPASQRELAEIDRAASALRSVQPDLEAWPDDRVEPPVAQRPRPIWPAVLVMWIGGIAILSVAIATTVSLVVG